MPKKLSSDEINLIDVAQIVWQKKIQVIFFIAISLLSSYILHINKAPSKINAITEIKPISVYDEERYKIYNSFLDSIKPYYINESVRKLPLDVNGQKAEKGNNSKNQSLALSISHIDEKFLLELFIDKLNEKTYLVKTIKNFGFIKAESYSNKLEYEQSVSNFASSIVINRINDVNFIEIDTYNSENLESFLKFIEESANSEIQQKLSEMFENYLKYAVSIRNFEIEDIQTQLLNTQNENKRIEIESKKNILSQNKYIERLQNIFDNSPVANTDNFYAARINYNSTDYQLKKIPVAISVKLFVSGILGAILGIFFVLIVNAFRNRQ
jgi:hypothetical protein